MSTTPGKKSEAGDDVCHHKPEGSPRAHGIDSFENGADDLPGVGGFSEPNDEANKTGQQNNAKDISFHPRFSGGKRARATAAATGRASETMIAG